jgi:hypothetical protein
MYEFGATLGRITELGSRKRMDAPAASVSRFQYRDPLAGTPELARGDQACGTGTDDNDMV